MKSTGSNRSQESSVIATDDSQCQNPISLMSLESNLPGVSGLCASSSVYCRYFFFFIIFATTKVYAEIDDFRVANGWLRIEKLKIAVDPLSGVQASFKMDKFTGIPGRVP